MVFSMVSAVVVDAQADQATNSNDHNNFQQKPHEFPLGRRVGIVSHSKPGSGFPKNDLPGYSTKIKVNVPSLMRKPMGKIPIAAPKK
jgi:hypothetical protein